MLLFKKFFHWLAAFLGLSLLLYCNSAAYASGWRDEPKAMAVDAMGNVYVTGTSATNGGQEIATLKYDSDGQLLWVRREAMAIGAEGTAIVVDVDGNVYVAGSTYTLGGYDYVVFKYDSGGTLAWLNHYNGPYNGSDTATAIALDPWGNVLVGGNSDGDGTSSDYALIKYRGSDGQQLWMRRYDGPANGGDQIVAVATDDVGAVYATGTSWGGDTYSDYATIKYDADGVSIWVSRYGSEWPGLSSTERARALVVDGESVYVTGVSYSWPLPGARLGGNYDTVKYRASSGEMIWMRRYNGPVNEDDDPRAMAIDSEGDIYVTGISPGDGTGSDYATVKYDASGVERWVRRFAGAGTFADEPAAISLDLHDNVCITGKSSGSGVGSGFATVKYDSEGNKLWDEGDSGSSTDRPVALGTDGQGNVYVTGKSHGGYTGDDYITIKYSSSGEKLWERRYTGVETQGDLAAGLTLDAEGNIYVTGTSYQDDTLQDYATVAYNPEGQQLWVRRYNEPGNIPDEAVAIDTDSHGNVYVTGNGSHHNSYVTIKYQAKDGRLRWLRRYQRTGGIAQLAKDLAVSPQGTVVVTGGCYFDLTTRLDYATVAYDFGGQQLWDNFYNGPASRYDWAENISIDEVGNVYVTGGSENSDPNSDYLTVKYNRAGQPLWDRRYDGFNEWDIAYAATTDSSGNLYVTGNSDGETNTSDVVTIKYTQSGVQDWLNRYTVPDQSYHGRDIAVDTTGNVYVTGDSWTSGSNYDYFIIKYNSAGNEQWVKHYNGPGNATDKATALVVDSDGNVYITGVSSGGDTFADYATVKYSPDGTELWVKRYNGPGNGYDNAVGLTLDGQGHLYVTGTSYGGSITGDDYATIRYRASDGQQLWVKRLHNPRDQKPPNDMICFPVKGKNGKTTLICF